LRLIVTAVLATTIVIVLGFLTIIPMFYGSPEVEVKKQIMLSFSILDSYNIVDWCKNVSSVLKTHNLGATVFIVGKVAEQNPECVTCFSERVDIGSRTFSNLNLTSLADYDAQLEEVTKGKIAVDTAGNLFSRVFKAPNQATDQNIYSLLSLNGILADFSYDCQYNIYIDNQFMKFEAAVFEGASCSTDLLLALEPTPKLSILHFESGYPTQLIEDLIISLENGQFDFVNASEVSGLDLTVRGV